MFSNGVHGKLASCNSCRRLGISAKLKMFAASFVIWQWRHSAVEYAVGLGESCVSDDSHVMDCYYDAWGVAGADTVISTKRMLSVALGFASLAFTIPLLQGHRASACCWHLCSLSPPLAAMQAV